MVLRGGGIGAYVAGVALATIQLPGCQPAGDCGGFCGPGTRCDDDRCVVEAEAPVEPAAGDSGGATKKKRRKGRRRKGKHRGDDGGDEAAAAPLKVDDSRVPRYNPNRTQTIGMGDGTERLSDFKVKNHMKKLEPKFNRCIERATMASDVELAGTVKFTIGVEPTGKVWGVTVKAPAAMKKAGVVACIRVAVHGSRFPTWDGPSMGVDYSFEVG